ncbi:tetratricopeptide repeat protein [Candidatus Peregrinibacteria bacterium]|jgi:tetratricopeptide (TPR) repeat protein|nr:tetratricopeptide repeat protein [Candidatus Peregrinibacteria bacterium]MBT4148428.1 tetratricopeptide repeat protein [Candidatus Peregrinibacteria bacterium]MBT4366487.1 tetratricopeptide repeat protein [Candidatus Peregrinibacteria bacterium]MBT4456062.1 tetratricopeptide repeat protein [Candidatus Peregrinibacteria bacterium]
MFEIHPLIEEADQLKNDGRHQEAIKICEKVLTDNLACTEAYEEIGDNYLSLREYDKAQKALKQAIKHNPSSANAHYLLGFVHSCTGDFTISVELLEVADELYPNHPEILRCLGWSMYHDKQKARGVVLLERALFLAPHDPLILNDLGVCHLNNKTFERASDLFKKTLTIEPNNEKAKECLNAVQFFKREYDKLKRKKKR